MAAQFRDYELPENVYKMCIFINVPFGGGGEKVYDFPEIYKGLYNPQKFKNHSGEVCESTAGP